MTELILPDGCVRRVEEIDPRGLSEDGYEAVICDLDNTLVPWGYDYMSPAVNDWLVRVKSYLKLAVVSNSLSERVFRLTDNLDVPAIPGAGKPRRWGYRRALDELGVSPEHSVVVGDQLLTDVLGGNRLGMKTILVVPLSTREFVGTRITRCIERALLAYLRWRGLTDCTGDR